MASKKEIVVGVDLGTGTCLLGLLEADHRVTILPTLGGETMIPSAVYFETDGSILVGGPAYNRVLANPHRGVLNVKRMMGQCDSQNQPIPAMIHPDTHQPLSPQEVASNLIRQMLQSVESENNVTVAGVVVTCPAYFLDSSRVATRQAVEMADYKVLHIINEPTAAAVAFGLEKKEKGTLLFVDGGHGTTDTTILIAEKTDTTILMAEKNNLRVLATQGNCELGGANLDELMVEHALKAFKEKTGKAIDTAKDLEVIYDLRDKMSRAKRDLSTVEKVMVNVAAHGKHLALTITRDEFNRMIQPLVEQMLVLTKETLSAAGLDWAQIDEVVLVGGTTYIPYLREQIKLLSGKQPRTDMNPIEAVVKGASIIARDVATRKLPEISPTDTAGRKVPGITTKIIDVNAHGLGVLAYDKYGEGGVLRNSVIIAANTPLPAQKQQRFELTDPRQTQARITIVQGPPDALEADCVKIGEVLLENLPPDPNTDRIQITYAYNIDGILEVTATDILSGRTTNGRIEHRAGILVAPGA